MSHIGRRSFLLRSASLAAGAMFTGSAASTLVGAPVAAGAQRAPGYGPLVPDRAGIVDLPRGFHYRILSRAGADVLPDGSPVPSLHDGMAAFPGGGGRTILVRNHEVDFDEMEEDPTVLGVPHVAGSTYDPNAVGGTTTVVVGADRRLIAHHVSLAGTLTNCAGGPTPWGTWLTCEETDEELDGIAHGYVFEVDPHGMGDPRPIRSMGRFEHEAVSFDRNGIAYLTEDSDGPLGLFYRFVPNRPLGGTGSLLAGGTLATLWVPELAGDDLSIVDQPGRVFAAEWLPVAEPDPNPYDATLRETNSGTRVSSGEGTWVGRDGSIWFVSSAAYGPDAEDAEERSSGLHGGQIWRLDPAAGTIELVVHFAPDHEFEGPDNITVAPYGYAVMCTDGDDDDQFLAGITPDGETFPLAYNRLNGEEFAGACFSPDGKTLFANIQNPGMTLAIWGPWRR